MIREDEENGRRCGGSAIGELVSAEVPEVPSGVVTVTSTVPVPAGDVAVTEVALLTITPVAALDPKWTAVAPVRSCR